MGEATILELSPRWELDEIEQLIKNRFNTDVKVQDCSKTSIGMYRFSFKVDNTERMMTVFVNSKTALGNFTRLSLGHDDSAVKIMTTIAKVFGGLLTKNDCDGSSEEIQGMFSESNGISYFYKYAVLNNELKDENDLVGLNESIYKWYDEVDSSGRSKMRLFDKEEK